MLLDTIQRDSLHARKARETEKATSLVTLFAECARIGKDAGNRASTDEEVVRVVRKFIKGLDDSLAVLTQADAITRAQREKSLLEGYLPVQLDSAALSRTIEAIVATLHDKSAKSMGAVMAVLKDKHAGMYDGAMASKLVKEILAACQQNTAPAR